MPTALGLTTGSKTSNSTKQSPAPPGTSNQAMGGNGRLDTISKRNHHAAREVETLFWRALCDSPEAAREYMAKDCIMINPLFAKSSKPMSKDTDPSIDQILEGCEPWTG